MLSRWLPKYQVGARQWRFVRGSSPSDANGIGTLQNNGKSSYCPRRSQVLAPARPRCYPAPRRRTGSIARSPAPTPRSGHACILRADIPDASTAGARRAALRLPCSPDFSFLPFSLHSRARWRSYSLFKKNGETHGGGGQHGTSPTRFPDRPADLRVEGPRGAALWRAHPLPSRRQLPRPAAAPPGTSRSPEMGEGGNTPGRATAASLPTFSLG